MSEQIIINFFDEEGDNKVREFFEDTPIFKEAENVTLETDKDFETLFVKVAEEHPPESWSDLKTTVNDIFQGNLDEQFARWETKMALDKNALKGIFNK